MKTKIKKLGFCFLIYDKINLEKLWNIFFKNVYKKKYKIYIHYKINVPLQYFEEFKLKECIETQYAHVSLIHAHNILFKKAYDDNCYKMINLSHACIPFKSFDYIYNLLCQDDYGYFNVSPHSQCFPNCNDLLNYYNEDIIQKSSEWFIINRKICNFILNENKINIDKLYSNIYAPEEIFFITLIYYNNLQNEIITTQNLSNDATTFTNWGDMDYKYGLKNYNFIDKKELIYLLNSKCLFGRKFNNECYSDLFIKEYLEKINSISIL
jgi:hypothetical protein